MRSRLAISGTLVIALAGCAGDRSREGPPARVRSPLREVARPEAPTATAAPVPTSPTAAPIASERAAIDLPTVLALAGEKPNAVRLAREQLALAEARESAAMAGFLPSVSLGGNFLRHDGTIQDMGGKFFETTKQRTFVGGTGEVTVDVYGTLYAYFASRRARDAARSDVEASVQDRAAEGAAAYYDLVGTQAAIGIARDALEHALEFERVAAARERKEVGLREDRLQADAAVAQARQAVISAEERLRVASASLATLLRLDPTITLLSADAHVLPITFVAPEAKLTELIASALAARPDLRAASERVAAAEEAEQGARLGPFVPTLRAGAGSPPGGGYLGGLGWDGPNLGSLRDREDYYAALEWRLTGLGLGEVARVRVAEAQLRSERIRADDVRDRIAKEVIAAHEAVRSRRAAIEVAREELAAADEARAIAERRLAQGVGLAVDVLAAEEARTRAATHLVEALVDYDKAQFRLLARLGERPGG